MTHPTRKRSDAPLLSRKQGLLYFLLALALGCILSRMLPESGLWGLTSVVESLQMSMSRIREEINTRAAASTSTTRRFHATVPHSSRRLDPAKTPAAPRVQFVFTMGLMGDGKLHEVLGNTIAKSPAMKRLEDLDIAPTKLIELHKLLYQNTRPKGKEGGEETDPGLQPPGLWNAHCEVGKTEANAQQLHSQIVQLLEEIKEMVHEAYASGKVPFHEDDPFTSIVPIPINTVLFPNLAAASTTIAADSPGGTGHHSLDPVESKYGRLTYPTQFQTQTCHRLDFASLDLWYATCQEAKVDCRHIYLYRPPLHDLKIHFTHLQAEHLRNNPTTGSGKPFQHHLAKIHLYNTMLHIMADEMHQYAPRNIGCMDVTNDDWKELWQDLWWGGASSTSGTTTTLDDMLRDMVAVFPKKDISRTDLAEVLPETTDPYVESYLQLHEAARDACHTTLRQVQAFVAEQQGKNPNTEISQ